MSRIKLIASDLDGTLLQHGSQVLRPETCGLIHRLKEKGILFFAASGRQYPNLRRLFAPVSEEIGYICENGCLSFFQGEMIHKARLSREIGVEILQAVRERENAEILLSGVYTCYLEPKRPEYYFHMRDVVKNDVTLVDDIFSVEEEYMKISVYEEAGIEQSAPYWESRFADKVQVVTSGNCWLDMTPYGVHKGYALELLQRRLGIAPDECMAFGDHYNDVEMLKSVGFPFAMEDAKEEIVRMCPYVTDRVEFTLEEVLKGRI